MSENRFANKTPLVNLVEHQAQGVQRMLEEPFQINASEMGTGKTLMNLQLIYRLGEKALVIAPAYMTGVWQNEIKKFYPFMRVFIWKGGIPDEIMNCDVILLSYGRIGEDSEFLFLLAKVLIFDEAQYLCNHKSQRTQAVFKSLALGEYCSVILATGTPIKNRVMEYWVLLHIIDSFRTGKFTQRYPNPYAFANHFSYARKVNIGRRQITQFDGSRNENELANILKYMSFKIFLKDVIELPEISYPVVVFQEDEADADLDKRLDEAFLLGHTSTIKAANALSKAKFTADLALNILESQHEPIIIFSDHPEALSYIFKHLDRHSYTCDVIDGSVEMSDRLRIVADFQQRKLDVVLCSIGAAGVGFTLTAAKTMIFNDQSWVPGNNDQAIARFYRFGQTETCRVIFVARQGIDEKITNTLKSKSAVLKKNSAPKLEYVDYDDLF